MLFLDVNVVVHTFRPHDTPHGQEIRDWVMERLGGHERIGVSELVLSAMVRIVTNGRIFIEPATPRAVMSFADALLEAENVTAVRPGERHWAVFRDLVAEHRLRGNGIPDAYLAAIAIESGATIPGHHRGFRRFTQLRTVDPLT